MITETAKRYIFQSTLPVWGATPGARSTRRVRRNFTPRSPCGERRRREGRRDDLQHFNPRSPCGERREALEKALRSMEISIHAPRVGSDGGGGGAFNNFNLISIHAPRVGSDCYYTQKVIVSQCISIHAPRVGSDGPHRDWRTWGCNFNPRSPCGERRPFANVISNFLYFNPRSPCGERRSLFLIGSSGSTGFQSTLPVWGATPIYKAEIYAGNISIHAPRVGSDTYS